MGMREATAYLLPFHMHKKIKQADGGHLSRLINLDDIFVNEYYFEDFDVAGFINSIDTVALEQNFLRGFIESTYFGLKGDKITFQLPPKIRMPLRDFILRVFHEKVSEKNTIEFRMSWELFAHLVHMTIYRDSDLYPKYNEAICRHYNIPRFLTATRETAKNSKCKKLHVGAILVVNGEIKVKGWNGHPIHTRRDDLCLRMNTAHGADISHGYCIHAEIQVLLRSNPTQLKKGIMFVTHAPCANCARHLVQSQVPFVVFERGDYGVLGVELAWDLAGKTRFYGV
jgi:dCMP deaminase